MCEKKPLFGSISGAADELGISERSIWRLIEAGELPTHKFGASTRIRRADLDAYIERSRRGPIIKKISTDDEPINSKV
jgi:excisionase family DNA binding protein